MPQKRITRRFKVKYTHRGLYKLNTVTVNTTDVFAKNRLSRQYDSPDSIYVYPAYSTHAGIIAPFSRVVGEAVRNRNMYEDPFEFKGIRDYTGTEPMKKINWHASAKTGDLKVNNYYDTTSRHVSIFIDIVNDQLWCNEEAVEECIRIARNYMERFIKNSVPVYMITNGRDVESGEVIELGNGCGVAFINDTLRKLARIDFTKKTERFTGYFSGHKAQKDELSILLSIDLSKDLATDFTNYLNGGSGEWVAPVNDRTTRLNGYRNINFTYVEVGR